MARLKLAAIFSDECVLQREKNIAIFGTGEEGTLVKANLCGKTQSACPRCANRQ